VKDKNSGVKLMGFGHRVYKNFDPRAKLMRETCHEVLEELGLQDDPLFKLAMELEKIALEDEYFVSRKLYPNVDFYSGIVQSALGIPVSLFTGIFAMARTVGWIAQWNEMIADPEQKIGRPRQLFVGATRGKRIGDDAATKVGKQVGHQVLHAGMRQQDGGGADGNRQHDGNDGVRPLGPGGKTAVHERSAVGVGAHCSRSTAGGAPRGLPFLIQQGLDFLAFLLADVAAAQGGQHQRLAGA
jgi:hypothetical protein